MNTDRLTKHISTAQEALRSFLATLLGGEAPLLVGEPTTADFDDANMRSKANIVFTAGTSQESQWAVALDPAWLPLLSKSMLGEPIEFGEPGADDLLRELAAQAYGAIRTQLHSAGVALAEADIELLERGKELGSNKFSPILYEIPFRITIDNQKLKGYAIIPYFDDAPAHEAAPRPEPFEIPVAAPVTSPQQQPQRQPSIQVASASFPELGNEVLGGDGMDSGFALLAEVELEVTVELGRRKIPLSDVLRLTTGSVIELEKLVGEPLEVYANGRLIAEGEAVVMDEQFGIRITNLASNRPRAKAFV
ncbi:MAG: flagellar motor switch protein FliN [Rhodothermales bacterium]